MLDKISIRELVSDDVQALSEFFEKNNVKEVIRNFNPFPLTKETAYKISTLDSFNKYYIAIYGERIIGLGMLRGWDEGFLIPSFGVLIDKEFQGIGLGKRMIDYIIAEAKRLKCNRIRLTVYATNKAAVNLYNLVGFKEISRTPVCIMEEQDEKILMCKKL